MSKSSRRPTREARKDHKMESVPSPNVIGICRHCSRRAETTRQGRLCSRCLKLVMMGLCPRQDAPKLTVVQAGRRHYDAPKRVSS